MNYLQKNFITRHVNLIGFNKVFCIPWFALLIMANVAYSDDSSKAQQPVQNNPQSTAILSTTKKTDSANAKKKSGIPLGTFLLLPELNFSEGYDTNIFSIRDQEQGSFIHVLTPSLLLVSDWDKHMLKLSSGAEMGSYEADSDQNYKDHWVESEGRFDLWQGNSVFGGAGYQYSHEDRSSPNNQFGLKPTFFSSIHSHLGAAFQFDRLTLRLGGTTERLDYRNVPTSTGIIDNKGRDRNVYGAGVRLGYKVNSDYEPFVQFEYDAREYDALTDRDGFSRDSSGYRAATGVKFNVGPRFIGELYAGYINQSYTDPRYQEINEPDFGANLIWKPSPRTTVNGSIDRSVEETIITGASSFLSTNYSVNINNQVTKKLSTSLNLSYINDDFKSIARQDDIISAGFGVKYAFTPNIYAAADYRYMMRDSDQSDDLNQAFADYDKNQIFLTVGTNLYPVKNDIFSDLADKWDFTDADLTDMTGFYLGGQTGYGSLATNTSGKRQSGSDDGEFGDNGFTGGLFGGYGFTLNRWYLGAEIEGEWSDLAWFHQKLKSDSRTFGVKKEDSVGLSGRLGYSLSSGNLLYAKVGSVWTNFKTDYTINNSPLTAVDTDNRLTGIRFGLGMDVPLTEHAFVRLDSTYTFYNGYDVSSADFSEDFDPEESLFRLGLGWNFGSRTIADNKGIDLSGFYAGGQLGIGTFTSDIDAQHRDSGIGPFPFTAPFSDHGFIPGVFVGYGYQYDHFYLGAELEGETSSANWSHVRDTEGSGGRKFSAEKKGGYGASGRLGYVLDNGTLLFGRFGVMNSRFNTKYAKGGNRDTDIDLDNRELGYRFGVGAESLLAHNLFIRLEYDYTNYPAYNFETTQSNSDVVEYDNSESLIRVGIGAHF
jgi:hypothetical protein